MSDAEGMKTRVTKAALSGNPEDIDKAMKEIWYDGYYHGLEDGYDVAKEEAELE